MASLHKTGRGLTGFVAPALGTGGTQLLSNRGATTQAREPNPSDAIGGSSKWFRLRPDHSGRIEVSTPGSEIDTVLTVFKVPADCGLTWIPSSASPAMTTANPIVYPDLDP